MIQKIYQNHIQEKPYTEGKRKPVLSVWSHWNLHYQDLLSAGGKRGSEKQLEILESYAIYNLK